MDHSGLKGKALIAAKKKHHIGPLKNKQQLIKALQKAAGEEPSIYPGWSNYSSFSRSNI